MIGTTISGVISPVEGEHRVYRREDAEAMRSKQGTEKGQSFGWKCCFGNPNTSSTSFVVPFISSPGQRERAFVSGSVTSSVGPRDGGGDTRQQSRQYQNTLEPAELVVECRVQWHHCTASRRHVRWLAESGTHI